MDTLGLLELISSLLATTEGHEQRVDTRWDSLVYDTHTQLKTVTRTTLYGMNHTPLAPAAPQTDVQYVSPSSGRCLSNILLWSTYADNSVSQR